jgi:hypothetical protein
MWRTMQRSAMMVMPRRRPRISWLFFIFLSIVINSQAFHRAPCKKIAVKYQFQFRYVVVSSLFPYRIPTLVFSILANCLYT